MGDHGADRRFAEERAARAFERASEIITAAVFDLPERAELIAELSDDDARLVARLLASWVAGMVVGFARQQGEPVAEVLPAVFARLRDD